MQIFSKDLVILNISYGIGIVCWDLKQTQDLLALQLNQSPPSSFTSNKKLQKQSYVFVFFFTENNSFIQYVLTTVPFPTRPLRSFPPLQLHIFILSL